VWLKCQTSIGRGKTKVLVRGGHGAEWVFCPKVRSIKKDRVSIHNCRRCPSFIRFEQTYAPKKRSKTAVSLRKRADGFHFAQPMTTWKGNISGTEPPPQPLSAIGEKQPLVDVFEEDDQIIVLMELPGVDEKDVNIKADDNALIITTENATKRHLKVVKLPTSIKRDAAKFTFRNNILQVNMKKLATKHSND
jgi:HSP20 family protein